MGEQSKIDLYKNGDYVNLDLEMSFESNNDVCLGGNRPNHTSTNPSCLQNLSYDCDVTRSYTYTKSPIIFLSSSHHVTKM